MTDTPTTGQATKEAEKSLPEPPTLQQLKEAEMARDSALASAGRSAEKVAQLKEKVEQARARASREKASLLERVADAEAETGKVRGQLADLHAEIEREAPLLDVLQKHYDRGDVVPRCLCPVCRMHQKAAALRGEIDEWKAKAKKLKDELKQFQGPRSKKRRK